MTLVYLTHILFVSSLFLLAIGELCQALGAWIKSMKISRVSMVRPNLVLFGEAQLKNRTYYVSGNVCRIGRSEDNDLIVHAPEVSRHHLMIVWNKDHWQISQLSTKAWTSLNGNKIPSNGLLLSNGDCLMLNQAIDGVQLLIFRVFMMKSTTKD